MKTVIRNILLISILTLTDVTSLKGQSGVNYDYATIAAMVSAYAAQSGTELLHRENTTKIAQSYSYAEVATAGIFASKLLDRNALKSVKGFGDPDENYYYKKIYRLVANKIIPRTISVTKKLIRDPSTAIYWGSHLMRVMADTKSLCSQFSAICTNSTLTFDDINFLEFTGTLENVFNLKGISDAATLFDNLSEIGSNFTTENIESEFDNLQDMAVGLASAGSSDVESLFDGSAFDGTFKESVGKIKDMIESNTTMWDNLQSSATGTLKTLTSGDLDDLTQILTTTNGNGEGWISKYISSSNAQFYKQRVYIYNTDSGSEILCQYDPPTDNDAILYGDHYTRFDTNEAYYAMSSEEYKKALQNSYNHAGWSKTKVDQMNAAKDGYTYSINTWSHGYSCYHTHNGEFNGYYAYSIAYSVYVKKSWSNTEIYYEDTFDSYSMSWSTFMDVMNAKLKEANDNEQGKVYHIGYDTKKYYEASNERKLAGATQANFVTDCASNGKITDGKIQYCCKRCGDNPDYRTKECSMETDLSPEPYDFTEINNAISNTESEMESLKSQINTLNTRNSEILKQLSKESIASDEYKKLQDEYKSNKSQITELQKQYDALNDKLDKYKQAKQEAIDFQNSRTDDANRIPSVMLELQKNFSLEWTDEGAWEDNTFVRHAKMSGLKTIVTFRATVGIAKAPVYLIGIKIRWARVKIEWELDADYSDTEVVETMTLDPTGDTEAQNKMVNDRLAELQDLYPDCAVSVQFDYAQGQQEDDNDDDKVHLLWASDRLDVAREVCHRLEAIYVDLVVLDKYLSYRYSILDWLKDATIDQLNADRGRRLTIAERSRRRWMHNGGSDVYAREEEDDDYEED